MAVRHRRDETKTKLTGFHERIDPGDLLRDNG